MRFVATSQSVPAEPRKAVAHGIKATSDIDFSDFI